MASTKYTLMGNRFANANRTWYGTVNVPLGGWTVGNDFIIALAYQTAEKVSSESEVRLYWRNKTDSGSFAELGLGGELNFTFASTVLVNGNAVVDAETTCDSVVTAANFAEGIENEAYNSATIAVGNDTWTEIHIAVVCDDAHEGDEYEFQLYDHGNGIAIGTCAATLTMASATIEVTPDPATAVGGKADPTIVNDTTNTPSAVTAVGSSTAPTIINDSVNTPAVATAIAAVVDPTIVNLVSFAVSPVTAVAATTAPTVSNDVINTPPALNAVGATADPSIVNDIVFVIVAASAIGRTVAPTVIIYKRFTERELEEIETALRSLDATSITERSLDASEFTARELGATTYVDRSISTSTYTERDLDTTDFTES
jgi:hypothetical protein